MSKRKSAFWFFLEQYVEEQRQKGRHISKKLASEECSTIWELLPTEKKQTFVDKARAHKIEHEAVSHELTRQGREKTEEVKTEYDEIFYLNQAIKNESDLRKHNFFLIHTNYYCKTVDEVYIPAEIAILEFNLEEGIKRTYHTIVSPSRIPLGYAFEVKKLSEETHGLPTPPHEHGEKDLPSIFNAIAQFVLGDQAAQTEYPPFFTLDSNVTPTTNILKGLSEDEDEQDLRIFPIHHMLFWLKNKCSETSGKGSGFPVLANAINEVERDVFRYCTGISCKFHNTLDEKYQNCSLSIIQRLVYVICDHCCKLLNIKLIGGKHVYYRFRKSSKRTAEVQTSTSESSSSFSDSESIPPSAFASVGAEECPSVPQSVSESQKTENIEGMLKTCHLGDEEDGGNVDDDVMNTNLTKMIRGRGRRTRNLEGTLGLPRR